MGGNNSARLKYATRGSRKGAEKSRSERKRNKLGTDAGSKKEGPFLYRAKVSGRKGKEGSHTPILRKPASDLETLSRRKKKARSAEKREEDKKIHQEGGPAAIKAKET